MKINSNKGKIELGKTKVKTKTCDTRPFLKWAGGKMKVLPELVKKFPKKGTRFIEPFLGAGSVSLNVDYPEVVVNDFNPDLFAVWNSFHHRGLDFIADCERMFVPENNTTERFGELKVEFNTSDDLYRIAVLFVYLNRHCFNGLCRYNRRGEFNVPKGSYEKVYFPRKEFEASLNRVRDFQIHNLDFREIFDLVRPGDVVYSDPPYLPLTSTANFSSYSSGGFGLKDHIDLANLSRMVAEQGATAIVSNHYNWYTKELYANKAKIYKIKVSRTISSKTTERTPVTELIAVFTRKD